MYNPAKSPSTGRTIPGGFLVCDGSVVLDKESPFQGERLPSLIDRFIMGIPATDHFSGGVYSATDFSRPPADPILRCINGLRCSSFALLTPQESLDHYRRHRPSLSRSAPDSR